MVFKSDISCRVSFICYLTTYFSVAAAWHQTLKYAGVRYSILSLVPLGVAKLFSDQVLPSGGMSGTVFLVASLNRRGISKPLCMAILLVSLVAYYIWHTFLQRLQV